jgi:hypothetical protein
LVASYIKQAIEAGKARAAKAAPTVDKDEEKK